MIEATARRPKSKRWSYLGVLEFTDGARTKKTGARVWMRSGLKVLSELADLVLPGRDDGAVGPTWLVSASYKGRRCTDAQVGVVRAAFGMQEAEEDNHEPGIARKLFLVVAVADRVACDCKEDEDVIEESDGYRWSNPKEGPCRGCELEQVTGQACTLHPATEVRP